MNPENSEIVIFDTKLKEDREYWIKYLSREIDPSNIILDFEKQRSYAIEKSDIDVSIYGKLYRDLVKFTNNSPFLIYTLLLSGLKLCIHKYTGSEVIAVGSPVLKDLGRANVLVIVDDVHDQMTFRQLVVNVRENLLEAYKRQAYPFNRLVRDLGLKNFEDRCPLFDVVLTLKEMHGVLPDLQNDMTITFARGIDDLSGRIEFNRNLLSSETVERFTSHLMHVLGEAFEDVNKPISDFKMLPEPERNGILREWNNTTADYPKHFCIHQLFEEQVEKTPNNTAAILNEKKLSYIELNEQANKLARTLREKGVKCDSVVGIMMDRSFEMLIGITGILKAGGAYLPIDLNYPSPRISYIFQESGMKFILTKESIIKNNEVLQAFQGEVVNIEDREIRSRSPENLEVINKPADAAYVIYTSGSTGKPKGVVVQHSGLVNYVWWAKKQYLQNAILDFPLFSPLSFDLTVTSIYVPLISGSKIVIYSEDESIRDLAILKVIEDNAVDIIKMTPSHLQLIKDMNIANSRVKKLIVGGEDLKSSLTRSVNDTFQEGVEIYNEYGPTEAVVGCMIYKFNPEEDLMPSVPIGKPADNVQIYLLDKWLNPVPIGVIGEIYIAGEGIARGYLNRPDLTAERFVPNPFMPGARMYRTGDLARWRSAGKMEFAGREDHQVKIRGARIELAEIEAELLAYADIRECVVDVIRYGRVSEATDAPDYCARCGLPSDFPGTTFDDNGICNMCLAFDVYKDKAFQYFKTMDDLRDIFERAKISKKGEYDCLMLYSGGKDSTYALCQLVNMGLKVLAFTLDNSYISEGAKTNIRRVVNELKVDHLFGTTPFMSNIFVDSLQKYSNVCNGCFKTIYTLGMNLAHDKGIKYIVTGLSRGQLFETRLAELFNNNIFNVDEIEKTVMEARKLYHRAEDVISKSLDIKIFKDDNVFEEIQFIDFYRYSDVTMDEIYDFLRKNAPWIRPEDTGRSTNCLINEVGIYVHKKNLGYHNYAFPYCWDVRLGHKIREAALHELNEHINVNAVNSILTEIGYAWDDKYEETTENSLVGYYVSEKRLTISDLRTYLAQKLPDYMIPSYFIRLAEMPLTPNGKVDRKALPKPKGKRPELARAFVAPSNPIEVELADIWAQLLGLEQVGIHDNFFELGGHSLLATRLMARVCSAFQVELPLRRLFEVPTIAALAKAIAEGKHSPAEARAPALVQLSREAHRMQRSALMGGASRSAGTKEEPRMNRELPT